eukprot:gene13901-biopygen9602
MACWPPQSGIAAAHPCGSGNDNPRKHPHRKHCRALCELGTAQSWGSQLNITRRGRPFSGYVVITNQSDCGPEQREQSFSPRARLRQAEILLQIARPFFYKGQEVCAEFAKTCLACCTRVRTTPPLNCGRHGSPPP